AGDGRLVPAGRGVVVGERDDVQARGLRGLDQFGRGVRAVRAGAVRMQVDAHPDPESSNTKQVIAGRTPITLQGRAAPPGRGRAWPSSGENAVQAKKRGESEPTGRCAISEPASRRSVSTMSS